MNPDNFPALCDGWFAGTLPPDDCDALSQRIQDDPAAARDFVRLARTDAALEHFFGGESGPVTQGVIHSRKPARLAWSLGAAAAIVVAGVWIAWQRNQALNVDAQPSVEIAAPLNNNDEPELPAPQAEAEPEMSLKFDHWIYKLKDGTPGRMRGKEFVPLAADGNMPSPENPIVSREALAIHDAEAEKKDPAPKETAELFPEPDPAPAPAPGQFEWEVVKLNGRDYVSAKSVSAFYRFTRREQNGLTMDFRSPSFTMKWTSGSREMIVNDCRFRLAQPLIESESSIFVSRADLSRLLEPVLRPTHVKFGPFKTVVIDAGHGGDDTGAAGLNEPEKVYTLDMARRLETNLRQAGFSVVMTRSDDSTLALSERIKIIQSAGSAEPGETIFISFHFHDGPADPAGGKRSGATTYFYDDEAPDADSGPPGSPAAKKDAAGPASDPDKSEAAIYGNFAAASVSLATAVHSHLKFEGKTEEDQGVGGGKFRILRELKMPAIMVIPGSVGDAKEAARIADPARREKWAKAISRGIQVCQKAFRGSVSGIRR